MKLILAEPFKRLWAGCDAFDAVEGLQGQVYRELEGRRTLRTVVDGNGFFVKIHRGIGWGEIVKNLITVKLPVLGADLLIHPAYNENTGTVLLEALVAGLPVLVSKVCGYAHYIAEADSGLVLDEPFEQEQLNQYLQRMLEDDAARASWARNGLAFADSADLYSMPEHAADVILAPERK